MIRHSLSLESSVEALSPLSKLKKEKNGIYSKPLLIRKDTKFNFLFAYLSLIEAGCAQLLISSIHISMIRKLENCYSPVYFIAN